MYQENTVAGITGQDKLDNAFASWNARIVIVSDKLSDNEIVLHDSLNGKFTTGMIVRLDHDQKPVNAKVKFWTNSKFSPLKTETIIVAGNVAKALGIQPSDWVRALVTINQLEEVKKPVVKAPIDIIKTVKSGLSMPGKKSVPDNIVRRDPISKPRKASSTLHSISSLLPEDMNEDSLVRLHASVMRDYVRDELAVFVNENTGLKTHCIVRGIAQKDNSVSPTAARAAYKLRTLVQYKTGDTITIRKPNFFEKLSHKVKESNYAYHAYMVGLLGVLYGIISNLAG